LRPDVFRSPASELPTAERLKALQGTSGFTICAAPTAYDISSKPPATIEGV
jgi:hypothetical protein